MNRAELIRQVANKTGLSRKVAADAVNAVFETISEALAAGERVTLVGFGSFEVRHREARRGVNPATGARIEIPPRQIPAFKAGRSLKQAVG